MTKYSIIVPTYNQTDKLKQLVAALQQQTQQGFEVILAIDGDKQTLNWARSQGLKHAYQGRYGRRYNEICNKAAQEAEGEYLLFISGDSRPVKDDYLSKFDEVMKHNRIVCGIRLNVDEDLKFVFPDHRLAYFRSKEIEPVMRIESDEPWVYMTSNGMCVSKYVWDDLDGFCEKYKEYGVVDADFVMRAYYRLGCECWWASDALLYHIDTQHREDTPGNYELFEKRRKEYAKHAI